MDADRQLEYARAVWQQQPSELPIEELAARAAFLRRSFGATAFVPWVIAGLLAVPFGLMLLNASVWTERASSALGLLATVYFLVSALKLIRTSGDCHAPCVRAYAGELRRQRDALRLCAITIALVMSSAALAGVPAETTSWKGYLGAASSLLTGLGVAAYVHGYARRYERRARAVALLETRD